MRVMVPPKMEANERGMKSCPGARPALRHLRTGATLFRLDPFSDRSRPVMSAVFTCSSSVDPVRSLLKLLLGCHWYYQ